MEARAATLVALDPNSCNSRQFLTGTVATALSLRSTIDRRRLCRLSTDYASAVEVLAELADW